MKKPNKVDKKDVNSVAMALTFYRPDDQTLKNEVTDAWERIKTALGVKNLQNLKHKNIQFRVTGTVSWVSKSGMTESIKRVTPETVLTNVKLIEGETRGTVDIKDGEWTCYGVKKTYIKILN